MPMIDSPAIEKEFDHAAELSVGKSEVVHLTKTMRFLDILAGGIGNTMVPNSGDQSQNIGREFPDVFERLPHPARRAPPAQNR